MSTRSATRPCSSLEGDFPLRVEGGFDMAVVHRGLVHVNASRASLFQPFKAGDQVSVLVGVGEDGTFMFRYGSERRPRLWEVQGRRFEAQESSSASLRSP